MSDRKRQGFRGDHRRAFTLIEVMLVAAILALLIAVLLPALGAARQHSRRVVCLTNQKQILLATGMYMNEHRDAVAVGPDAFLSGFTRDGIRYNSVGSNCMWGGSRGEIHSGSRGDYNRPLTRYMYRRMPADEALRVFVCPSDTGTPFWEPGRQSISRVCGNSYYMNTHGYLARLNSRSRVSPSRRVIYEEANMYWLLGHMPASMHPFGYGQNVPPQQGKGWHGGWSRFNVAFMDLHAAHLYIDTTRDSGPDWTVREFPRIWAWLAD